MRTLQQSFIQRVNHCISPESDQVGSGFRTQEEQRACWSTLDDYVRVESASAVNLYASHRQAAADYAHLLCTFQTNGPVAYMPCLPKHVVARTLPNPDSGLAQGIYNVFISQNTSPITVLQFGADGTQPWLVTQVEDIWRKLQPAGGKGGSVQIKWLSVDVIPNIEHITETDLATSSEAAASTRASGVSYVGIDALREHWMGLLFSEKPRASVREMPSPWTSGTQQSWRSRLLTASTSMLLPQMMSAKQGGQVFPLGGPLLDPRHPIVDWVISIYALERIPATYHRSTMIALCRAARLGLIMAWSVNQQECEGRLKMYHQFVVENDDRPGASNIRPLSKVTTCLDYNGMKKFIESIPECSGRVLALGPNTTGTGLGALVHDRTLESTLKRHIASPSLRENIIVFTRATLH